MTILERKSVLHQYHLPESDIPWINL